ncbi:hybrid sensor histidine kinase/response regulator [Brasilonema octagenarum UFV-E1]|uniref:Circadian input-output histidine kinase CikA n=2 Tax=Bromeliae group (in: Brasilonema) TaxID=3398495 RepID=A0A856MK84_9CYAN|nr:hybrid sensor histidine kinase/response regulator [Brasilonema sennae CENA114]QDL16364.1 hybrid sensor histidine kinase/response regulator [Brasilonema octagenarum UFV-E1]
MNGAGFTVDYKCVATKVDYLTYLNCGCDAIVAEDSLKDLDALEALQEMHAQGLNIPFVIINGTDSAFIAVRCIKAGATDYLSKDELARLPEIIKQVLGEKTQSSQLHKEDLRQELQEQTAELGRQKQHSQQVEATLQKVELQLQTLITKNADGIVVVDRGGIVRFINPAALNLFACKQEELLGELFGFPVVGGDNTEVDIYPYRCNTERTAAKDSLEKIAQMRVVEIEWQGEAAYLVSLRDITERKRAEDERNKLLEEAQAANRIKDEFLAVLSHELRTPLNPILGWVKLLRSGKLNDNKKEQALETIERNASLQVQLINDLLSVSKILRGKLTLNPIAVNLQTIITKAIESVDLAAQAKSIEILTVFDANLGVVFGDSKRLQQVMWNLLSNAVKFTPSNGQVTVRLKRVGLYAQVQVIDTGKGIKPEFLPYIFDYFRQQDSGYNRKFGGLGLGLSLVRHLVELHGGTIEAESRGEGKGATFTVRLPLMLNPSITQGETQKDDKSPDLYGVRVLVVDDEPDNRDFLAFLLEAYGACVSAAASAHEALSSLVEEQPDLLVSDIQMPEMDGYMLIRQIRSLPAERGGQIPAIALTAYAGQTPQQQANGTGFTLHFPKPIEPVLLATAIANLVEK